MFLFALIYTGCEEEDSSLAPVACFEIQDSIFAGIPAQFKASCSENAVDYSWSFEDGSSAGDSIVSHIFQSPGTYKVTLTVSNADGDDEITQNVTVFGNKTVEVDYDITSDVTWKKDSVYVIKNDIDVDAVLTIEAGTVIKFEEGVNMGCDDGKIIAKGTSSLPIIFTSIRDDSYGGDINNDGSGTTPEKGDWNFISIGGTNNSSEFNYCEFYYGGGYTDYLDYTLFLKSSNIKVDHCLFAHNIGMNFGALSAKDGEENITITNNIFYKNDVPLGINDQVDIDNSNTFHNPDNPTETNVHNGIYLFDTYTGVKGERIWSETEVPFVLYAENSQLKIKSGNSLKIAPGVVVKLNSKVGIYVDGGLLLAQGTESERIVFTSIHDDSFGGDTDANGDDVPPYSGDWNDIRVLGDNNSSKFEYCDFYYGGGYSDYLDRTMYIESNNTIVDNCVFAYNKGESLGTVNVEEAASGTKITNNVFYGNEKPLFIGGGLDIDDSNIFHNPADATEKNLKNGIFMNDAGGRITGERTWGETEVPIVVAVNVYIEDGNSLTLSKNVILKFDTGIGLRYTGTNLSGHESEGVWFTSYKDDSKGGDTNGDKTNSSPSAGDWKGVYSNATSDYETWSNILYSEN
jgi:hypothetical protein